MRRLRYLILTLTLLGLAVSARASALPPSFFLQGGNSFGETAVLGTNDSFPLVVETNNTERIRIDDTGFLFTGTFDTSPSSVFHIKGGHFLFESADDFMLKAPDYNPTASINLHYMDATNVQVASLVYDQGSEAGLSINVDSVNAGIYISNVSGNVRVGQGITLPEGTLQVASSHGSNSTLYVGSSQNSGAQRPGCLVLGDSDGLGVTYVIANDGILTASTSKPSICD